MIYPDTIRFKKLGSGYWHIRGEGVCNWCQVPSWPCTDEELEQSWFPEASMQFRNSIRQKLTKAQNEE